MDAAPRVDDLKAFGMLFAGAFVAAIIAYLADKYFLRQVESQIASTAGSIVR